MARSQPRQGTFGATSPTYEAIADTLPSSDQEESGADQEGTDARGARARGWRVRGSAASLLGAGLLVLAALALAAARGRWHRPRESGSSLTRAAAVEGEVQVEAGVGVLDAFLDRPPAERAGAGEPAGDALATGSRSEGDGRRALTVISAHPDLLEAEGTYFAFSAQDADEVFGTGDWSGQVFRMSNGLVTGNVAVWRDELFCRSMNCGRWEPSTLAGPGNWSVGDRLVLRPERSATVDHDRMANTTTGMATTTTGMATTAASENGHNHQNSQPRIRLSAVSMATTTGVVTTTVSPAPLFEFYMYRANAADAAKKYSFGNINTGNLDGVVWYLMNEVVTEYTDGTRCPRKFNISQINRYRIRTRATKEIYEADMSFGTRFSFDFGKCMGRCFPDNQCSGFDDCDYHYGKYGFNVGCNNFLDHYPFPDGDTPAPGGTWYSLPLDGRCRGEPTGAKDCTWSYEDAGVLSLEEIEATNPWGPNCCPADRCTGFWEDQFDEGATSGRVQAIQSAFAEKYPDWPQDIGPSQCDFRKDEWYTADTDIWPPQDPWAEESSSDEDAEPTGDVGDGAQIGSQEWLDDST